VHTVIPAQRRYRQNISNPVTESLMLSNRENGNVLSGVAKVPVTANEVSARPLPSMKAFTPSTVRAA
jgi:hypothetical protein